MQSTERKHEHTHTHTLRKCDHSNRNVERIVMFDGAKSKNGTFRCLSFKNPHIFNSQRGFFMPSHIEYESKKNRERIKKK